MDRAHRLGQTREVTVYRLICKGTVEEKIVRRAQQKQHVQQLVMAGSAAGDTIAPEDVLSLLMDEDDSDVEGATGGLRQGGRAGVGASAARPTAAAGGAGAAGAARRGKARWETCLRVHNFRPPATLGARCQEGHVDERSPLLTRTSLHAPPDQADSSERCSNPACEKSLVICRLPTDPKSTDGQALKLDTEGDGVAVVDMEEIERQDRKETNHDDDDEDEPTQEAAAAGAGGAATKNKRKRAGAGGAAGPGKGGQAAAASAGGKGGATPAKRRSSAAAAAGRTPPPAVAAAAAAAPPSAGKAARAPPP